MSKNFADFTVRLIDKISGPSRKMTAGLGKFSAGLGQVGAAGRKLQRDTGGRGGMLGSIVGGNLVTSAIMQVGRLASGIVAAGAEMVTFGQNSRLAFQQLATHGDAPERLFEHSRLLAKRFGLDLMDTTEQYKKFLMLRFSPKAAGNMIKMGADLRSMKLTAEQVSGVFMTLGQIKAKGKFQAEEGLQLAERGVDIGRVNEEIGKLLGGKSVDQVRALQQKGKITADIALKAIENAINGKLGQSKLGESGAKFADQTLEGMWGRFKAIGTDKGIDMVDKMTGPLTKLASEGLGKFEKFIESPAGSKMIDSLATGLGKAAEFAGVLIKEFGGGFGGAWGELTAGGKALVGMFGGGEGQGMANTMKLMARGLGQLSALAIGFGIAFFGAAAVVGTAGMLIVGTLTGIVQPILHGWQQISAGLTGWWDSMTAIWRDGSTGFLSKVWETGTQIVTGLIGGVRSMWSMVPALWAELGANLIGTFKNVLGIHSPSKVFAGIGMQTGQGFAVGLERSTSTVQRAGAGLGQSATWGASTGGGLDIGGPRMTSSADMWGPQASAVAAPAPEAAAGGVSFSVGDINVSVSGAGSDAGELAQTIGVEIERRIEAVFRHMAAEVG